jgi:NADPH-dependent curcumin reductase CurA
MPVTNRQWLLARRPSGTVCADDFRFTEAPVPAPGEEEVLVRTVMLSCDPTQRGWMARDTYLPAVKLGEVMRSFGIGRVVASRHPDFQEGQLVQGMLGWQDYALARPADAALRPVPPGIRPEQALGVFGVTGLTAYFGLLEVGRPAAGEAVVVSAAAGATGSVVGQIAKLKGCRTVGIAGGAEKCRRLTAAYGYDVAIDYKAEDVGARLAEACPGGVDVYFDNVGGEILDAVLARLALRGRVVLCGGISQYDATGPVPGPRNYLNLVSRRGRMEGFLVLDYLHRAPEAVREMARWVGQGLLKTDVDVQRGLENAPAVLARLFRGENQGKQLLAVAELEDAG